MKSGYSVSKQYHRACCTETNMSQSNCINNEISQKKQWSFDMCDNKTHQNPLLGIEDPLWKKQSRAFTIQAEQGIWDIGAPEPSMVKKSLRKSRFQMLYNKRLYPFFIDYSGSSTIKISWTDDIEQCRIFELIKDTVEAQTDNEHWSNIGLLVFKDLLRHVSPAKLATALHGFSQEFRRAMRRNNETTSRRLLVMLKELALVTTTLGPELACYAFDLFNHAQHWLLLCKHEVGDSIAYGRPTINELFDELHAIFEVISGPEKAQAIAGMKLANPNYEIPTQSSEVPK